MVHKIHSWMVIGPVLLLSVSIRLQGIFFFFGGGGVRAVLFTCHSETDKYLYMNHVIQIPLYESCDTNIYI